jgi:hypothetical protein
MPRNGAPNPVAAPSRLLLSLLPKCVSSVIGIRDSWESPGSDRRPSGFGAPRGRVAFGPNESAAPARAAARGSRASAAGCSPRVPAYDPAQRVERRLQPLSADHCIGNPTVALIERRNRQNLCVHPKTSRQARARCRTKAPFACIAHISNPGKRSEEVRFPNGSVPAGSLGVPPPITGPAGWVGTGCLRGRTRSPSLSQALRRPYACTLFRRLTAPHGRFFGTRSTTIITQITHFIQPAMGFGAHVP